MKIISYNILEGMAADTSPDKRNFIEWVRAQNTDILALQEVNRFTKESLGRLARAYGHPYVALSKEKGYPVALTSRYPIEQPHIIREPMTHGCLIAEIARYRIAVLHLDPFSCRKRKDELQLVLHTIEHERRLSGKDNWILMGDFNSFSPIDQSAYTDNRYRDRILELPIENPHRNNLNAGEIDYALHRSLLDGGYIDALRTKYPEFVHTFPTRRFYPLEGEPIWIRYDYIYLSADLQKKFVTADPIRDPFTEYYSDHYPIGLILQ